MESIVAEKENQALVWIFPLDCVIPNAKTAILQSQITIVQNIVKNYVSLPIPFYYNLSQTAFHYHPIRYSKFKSKFSVHPKFNNHFADEIPSECIYEIWFNEGSEKEKNLNIMEETITKQLFSLNAITQKIENDMYSVLKKKSPVISLHYPHFKPSWAVDSQLWYNFTLLDTACKEIDNQILLSKNPIDRELSFSSIRLKRRIMQSDNLSKALKYLNIGKAENQYIFEVSDNSVESKIREGDFQCIISPEIQPDLINKKTYTVKQGTALEKIDYGSYNTQMKSLLEISIKAFSRERKLIAIKFNLNKPIIEDLEDARIASFKAESIIDPTVHDFFSKKLKLVLDAVGNPINSTNTKTTASAIGIYELKKPKDSNSALSTFLWDP
ncbi:MAG: hypothetical protein KAH01_04790, partial [Caldisericia bacterium]|nr:hypothetical protein [Caldisericia bacterium]